MQVTDVQSKWSSNLTTETDGRQLIDLGVRLRLFSIIVSGEESSGTDEIIVVLRSGGASGDEIFGFSIGRQQAQKSNSVINLPEQGILFEDGLYIKAEPSGFRYVTVSVQPAGDIGAA